MMKHEVHNVSILTTAMHDHVLPPLLLGPVHDRLHKGREFLCPLWHAVVGPQLELEVGEVSGAASVHLHSQLPLGEAVAVVFIV